MAVPVGRFSSRVFERERAQSNPSPKRDPLATSIAALDAHLASLTRPQSPSRSGSTILLPRASSRGDLHRSGSSLTLGIGKGKKPSTDSPRLCASDPNIPKSARVVSTDEKIFSEIAVKNFALISRETIRGYSTQQRVTLVQRLREHQEVLKDPTPIGHDEGSSCAMAAARDREKGKNIEEILKQIEKVERKIRDPKLLGEIEADDPEMRELLKLTNQSIIPTSQLFKAIRSVHKTPNVDAQRTKKHLAFCRAWLERNRATTQFEEARDPIESIIRKIGKHSDNSVLQQNCTLKMTLQRIQDEKKKEVAFVEPPPAFKSDFQALLDGVLILGHKGDCSQQVEMVASDLFFFQKTLFSQFTPDDLVANKWPKNTKVNAKSSPLMNLYSDFSNKLSLFLISQVVSRKDEKNRAALISFFMKVAASCKAKGDIASMVSIVNAIIAHTAIGRLQNSWKHLSNGPIEKIKKELESLCNPKDRLSALQAYCEKLSESQTFHIPYFAGTLCALVSLEDKISPVLKDGETYNKAKMKEIYQKIETALQAQKWQPKFAIPKAFETNLVQDYLKRDQPDDEALYAASWLAEPRVTTPEP